MFCSRHTAERPMDYMAADCGGSGFKNLSCIQRVASSNIHTDLNGWCALGQHISPFLLTGGGQGGDPVGPLSIMCECRFRELLFLCFLCWAVFEQLLRYKEAVQDRHCSRTKRLRREGSEYTNYDKLDYNTCSGSLKFESIYKNSEKHVKYKISKVELAFHGSATGRLKHLKRKPSEAEGDQTSSFPQIYQLSRSVT